ncbi:hypothetical protein [Lentzea sp. NPDC059081]|uniref:hypothetical protein n=1 Tax=Lentzea sp. NPDC059081 TaxID=3346719 RepID=UPI003681DBA8
MTPASPRELRSSLNKAAFVLARATSRHPGSVNRELNGVMGIDRRAEASKEQLREALRYVGERLRALGGARRSSREAGQDADFSSGGDPPF